MEHLTWLLTFFILIFRKSSFKSIHICVKDQSTFPHWRGLSKIGYTVQIWKVVYFSYWFIVNNWGFSDWTLITFCIGTGWSKVNDISFGACSLWNGYKLLSWNIFQSSLYTDKLLRNMQNVLGINHIFQILGELWCSNWENLKNT